MHKRQEEEESTRGTGIGNTMPGGGGGGGGVYEERNMSGPCGLEEDIRILEECNRERDLKRAGDARKSVRGQRRKGKVQQRGYRSSRDAFW